MTPDEELVDDGTDADFDAGFADTQTVKPPETSGDGKGATAAAETTAGDGKGEQVVPAAAGADATPAAPEYVQLTKAELEELKASSAKTAAYDKQLASINGSLGYLKQHIKPAADATAGTKDGAATTPPVDDARQGYLEVIIEHEMDVLRAEYPNWRAIVGAPDQGGAENADPKHPFRVWLAAQTAEYQAKITNANSSVIIMRAIEKFNDDAAKAKTAAALAAKLPSPQIAARKAVIKEAIQPRGDGGQPSPAKSDEDHFAEGFKTG